MDTRRRLDEALAARSDYTRSETFQAAYARAVEHLRIAAAASSEPVRGKEGCLALDELAEAFDGMLAEYGIAYRKSHLGQLNPWMGVTLDDIKNFSDSLTIADSATKPYSWIRIVFDYGQRPDSYDDVVKEAHDRSFKIIGAPIDSQAAKKYVTTESYFERMKSFVERFPMIDAWEDVVLLSAWVEDAPMGIAFDQVMRTLQYEFPGKYIGLDELGYWGDRTPKAWWAYDEHDRDLGRRRVAAQYYPAALGYERSIGGSFWWYFYTDVVKKRDADLRATITNITKALNAGTR